MTASRSRSAFSLPLKVGLFLLSTATLIFEINLSRLFSVAQFYHFAFMIVSLALLGFGASGTFLTLFPRIGRQEPTRTLSLLGSLTALSILGAYLLFNLLPFDSFSIAWDRRQVLILGLHYLALALPFFFSGMAVGLFLDLFPHSSGGVYAVNLTGSALGCLVALLAPSLLGGTGTVLLSSSLAALAGLLPAFARRTASAAPWIPGLFAGLSLGFSLFVLGVGLARGTPLGPFELAISPYKSLSYALQLPGAELISQRWNAFSRVDLVGGPAIRSLPGVSFRYLQPPPPEQALFTDGEDLSPVVLSGSDLAFSAYLPAALAFELRPGARTLVLSPGGGLDLLTARELGGGPVTAVEVNPLIVSAAPHIYGHPQVQTVLESDRSYLRRSQESFNLVLFTLASSYHPVRSGAYSLAEDYRYTQESFGEALEHLAPGGLLVVTRWLQVPPSEWLRAFTLAATALENQGLDPAERIAALRSFNLGLLLVKREPFTPGELQAIRAFAASRAFDLAYLPDLRLADTNRFNVLEAPLYFQAFRGYLAAPSREAWLAAYPYEVSPPTDNHPFFGHFFKWSQASQIFAELGKSWQPFGGAGYFVLLVLLALAVVLAVLIILLPLLLRRTPAPGPRPVVPTLLYFGLIGLAFLLVEIPLVQRFILYLGNPAYAFTTALFAILLFSGLGSYFSGRIPALAAFAALITTALVTPWLLTGLFNLSLGAPLGVRLLLAVLALAPLGFLMGVPFPSGIQNLNQSAPGLIPWAWGINGALSVISSILAALIALSFGFSWSLLTGALCYLGALAVLPRLKAPGTRPTLPG